MLFHVFKIFRHFIFVILRQFRKFCVVSGLIWECHWTEEYYNTHKSHSVAIKIIILSMCSHQYFSGFLNFMGLWSKISQIKNHVITAKAATALSIGTQLSNRPYPEVVVNDNDDLLIRIPLTLWHRLFPFYYFWFSWEYLRFSECHLSVSNEQTCKYESSLFVFEFIPNPSWYLLISYDIF